MTEEVKFQLDVAKEQMEESIKHLELVLAKIRASSNKDKTLPCICPESILGIITFAQVSLFNLASKLLSLVVYSKA